MHTHRHTHTNYKIEWQSNTDACMCCKKIQQQKSVSLAF